MSSYIFSKDLVAKQKNAKTVTVAIKLDIKYFGKISDFYWSCTKIVLFKKENLTIDVIMKMVLYPT